MWYKGQLMKVASSLVHNETDEQYLVNNLYEIQTSLIQQSNNSKNEVLTTRFLSV
jgi:hypothetical protein